MAELEKRQNELEPQLKNGGPGGTSGGMEPRVAKLEAAAEHIQKDIGDIKSDVRDFRNAITTLNGSTATLTERVAHLPSKGFVVTAAVTALTVTAALIAFQGQIQTFFKLSH